MDFKPNCHESETDFLPLFSGDHVRTEKNSTDLHQIPDAGTREGIPLQQISNPTPTDRDRSYAWSNGTPD